MNYLIVSPINGKLTYLGALTENEFIEKGAEIFAIIPSDQHYVCLGSFAAQGFGKVKIGQDVRIKLDNFPDFQYGSLPGRIESISPIPNQKQYQVKIKLENNLISTYNKKILFTPEMTGTAEIITEDLTLIKRIFHTLRGLI